MNVSEEANNDFQYILHGYRNIFVINVHSTL